MNTVNKQLVYDISTVQVFIERFKDVVNRAGELDEIKKLPYQECIALRNKRLVEFEPDSPKLRKEVGQMFTMLRVKYVQ
jgi:hypothetical protein